MIKLEKQQGIAIVTLSRAQKQNALSFAMFVELNKIIKKLKKDRSIRAVVLKRRWRSLLRGVRYSRSYGVAA